MQKRAKYATLFLFAYFYILLYSVFSPILFGPKYFQFFYNRSFSSTTYLLHYSTVSTFFIIFYQRKFTQFQKTTIINRKITVLLSTKLKTNRFFGQTLSSFSMNTKNINVKIFQKRHLYSL